MLACSYEVYLCSAPVSTSASSSFSPCSGGPAAEGSAPQTCYRPSGARGGGPLPQPLPGRRMMQAGEGGMLRGATPAQVSAAGPVALRGHAGWEERSPPNPAGSLRAPCAGGTCHLQRPGGVQGAEGIPGAQAGPLHHVVVRPAEEAVLPQREFITGDELAAAGHAAETLDVVHLGAGAHHEVILAEADATLGTLDAV